VKANIRRGDRPLFGERALIEIRGTARAPIDVYGTARTQREKVFDDRFDRRKTGTARHENHGPLRIFTRHEGAERTFDAQHVAFLEHIAHP
jgi:hypothetical protein